MERDEFVSHVIDEACSGLGTNESLLIDVSSSLIILKIHFPHEQHWCVPLQTIPRVCKQHRALLRQESSGKARHLVVSSPTVPPHKP